MTNENVKEIASIAWKGAANAHRMYPDNNHTFSEYWNGAESQFNKFCQPDVSNRSFNELEMLAEDLECVKMWLDNKNVATHDKDNNQYSVIGRIELLLNGC